MMSTIGTTTAATAVATNSASTAPPVMNDAAQDRFLELLVTQLKNQDPLNPMDNAEITSQMAQISTVSGITQLNATMQSMAASFSSGQSLQATSMIGRGVLAPANSIDLQAGSALGGVDLSQAVDAVVVTIRDNSGQLMHQVDLGPQPAGVLGFQWDGVTDSGATAAAGTYSLAVEALQGGKKIDAIALAGGMVNGFTVSGNKVTLNVSGVGQVALADVKQVM